MTQLIKQSWTSYPNIFFLFVCFVCTKLFVCFVDLQKAFDSVWRNGLSFKLVKIGVGKQLYNIVKQQLSKTETTFKFENSHSNFFQIHRG